MHILLNINNFSTPAAKIGLRIDVNKFNGTALQDADETPTSINPLVEEM